MHLPWWDDTLASLGVELEEGFLNDVQIFELHRMGGCAPYSAIRGRKEEIELTLILNVLKLKFFGEIWIETFMYIETIMYMEIS